MIDNRGQRLAFVESIRLLAGVLVVMQHLFELHRDIPGLDAIVHLGPGMMGVLLFFLVSGYVVPMSVRNGAFDPLAFMLKRAFRIYPLMLAAFALVAIAGATGLLHHWQYMAAAGPQIWIANLLLVQEYLGVRAILGVTWTLSVEFLWYGIFALAYWRLGDRAGRWLAVAVPVVLVVLAILSLASGVRIPLGRLNLVYACVLGYQAYLFDKGVLDGRTLARQALLFVAVMVATNLVAFGAFHHAAIRLEHVVLSSVLCPAVFLAVICWGRLRNARVLNSGVLPITGSASFSIYLLHPVAIALAAQYAGSWPVAALWSLILTAMLGTLGYCLVERPGIALGRKLVPRISANLRRAVPEVAR